MECKNLPITPRPSLPAAFQSLQNGYKTDSALLRTMAIN